jgi:hypothetical protein
MALQLPIQAVPITTKVVSSNTTHSEVHSIQQYVIKFVSDLQQIGGFPVSSINISDRHNITEILLKVALNTITLTIKIVVSKKLISYFISTAHKS